MAGYYFRLQDTSDADVDDAGADADDANADADDANADADDAGDDDTSDVDDVLAAEARNVVNAITADALWTQMSLKRRSTAQELQV